MKFTPAIFHPNGMSSYQKELSNFSQVYDDGNVCISILHPPGDDPLMYERSSERWSPVQSVEKVCYPRKHTVNHLNHLLGITKRY